MIYLLTTGVTPKLPDVEEAQMKIVNVIRSLEDKGEIVISRGQSDEMMV